MKVFILITALTIYSHSVAQDKQPIFKGVRTVKIINVERYQSLDYYFLDAIDSITNKEITILSDKGVEAKCGSNKKWLEIIEGQYYTLELEILSLLGLDLSTDSLRRNFYPKYTVTLGDRMFFNDNQPYYAKEILKDRICK